jgi:alpha-beta hydrolase superfamily lysophospholipase
MIQTEGFFPSNGRWLFYRCWYTDPKLGEIIVVHGAAEHSGRYQELAKEVARAGYNCYTFDLTGHGRSEGKRSYINKFEEYLVDIANFYGFLRVYRSMQEPIVFGHSMGGLLAALFACMGHCPLKGVLLSAPLFRLKTPVSLWTRFGLGFLNLVYPTFYLENRLNPSYLTHDHEIIEDYMADPLVQHHVTTRWFLEMLKAMKNADYIAPFLQIPCLLLHGEEDHITDIEGSKKFFDKLTTPDKDFFIVPGGYHELLNETGRGQLILRIIEWLKTLGDKQQKNEPDHRP